MIIFNDQIIIVLIIYLLCEIFGRLETINLIFWLGLLVYYISYQKNHYIRKVKDKKYIYYGLIISVISIIMAFNSGYFIGFVKSPFKHNLISIVKNSCQLLIPIIGIELTRNILINKYKYNKLSRVLITILLILLEVNYKINSIKITPEANEDDQVEILNNTSLNYGKNEILIRVTSPDKTTTTYKLIVTRLKKDNHNWEITNILFYIFIILIFVMISLIIIFINRNIKKQDKPKKFKERK